MVVLSCIFAFLLGCCVGSFANVLAYRLPEHKSIVRPRSQCPKCNHLIAWYDNVPLLSWLLLGGRCRHCKGRISGAYPLVELLTGLAFTLVFVAYMFLGLRELMPLLTDYPGLADWAALGLHLWLIAAMIAASAVDFRRSEIPISITSLTAVVAMVVNGLFPQAMLGRVSAGSGGMALGGCLGLLVSAWLLKRGIFKSSFEQLAQRGFAVRSKRRKRQFSHNSFINKELSSKVVQGTEVNPRLEILWEVLYLCPVVLLGTVAGLLLNCDISLVNGGRKLLEDQHVNAVLASLFGMFVGGGVVWLTRILGTLAFGREAMGLGDVHLMAAAGAVLGWLGPVLGFFIAPFYGLLAVLLSIGRQRRGELPYGPWLSLGVLTAMIFQDKIWAYVGPGLKAFWQLLTG